MAVYEHIPHPHVHARKAQGPVKVRDQHPTGTAFARFNTKFALIITSAVGSMWCAYVFGLFDLISLPEAIKGGASTIVAWIAQTFLQLVLLSVIMVGQNVQADAADKRSEATWHDAEATLHEMASLQAHLAAQDSLLTKIALHLGLDPVPVIDPVPSEDAVEAIETVQAAQGDKVSEDSPVGQDAAAAEAVAEASKDDEAAQDS